ncbi:hypothetical protein MRB53_028930 [Persea americana]|uniref:Uncharacterized protein n=1 Tax=Persea americana TaxID=3435 RepID=A0ACC2KH42_PERAE|nr:hypothetical protein MRB53_028930 [Persea americana]
MRSLLLLPSLPKISISTLSAQNPKTLFSSTTPKPSLLSHLHLPNQTLISCRSINKKQKKRNDFRVWADDDDVESQDPDDYDMDEDEAKELDSKDYDIEYDLLLLLPSGGASAASRTSDDIEMVQSESFVSTQDWESDKVVDYRINEEQFHKISLLNCDFFIRKPPDPDDNVYDFREECCQDPKISAKVFDMLFRIYSDAKVFDLASETFDFMKINGWEIDDRSCSVYLIALIKAGLVDSALEFFHRMVESGVSISVYSMTIVVGGLCKKGEVKRARELVVEMGERGIKPNIVSYNTLIEAYVKKGDFDEADKILSLIDDEGITPNAVTYTILIGGLSGLGRVENAEKLFEEMSERGVEADVHVYTSIIDASCRVGNMKRAFALFDECVDRGIDPNAHTYGALINGLCKSGQVEAAKILLNEMQSKGIDANLVIFNTLMYGYCKKGLLDEALKLQVVMEKKGLKPDVFAYNTIASGLCKSNRIDEAKRLLYAMVERGVESNTVTFTTLIDIHCKEGDLVEAKRILSEMEKKGVKPSNVTYNAMIDGYSKKGSLKDAQKLKDEMKKKGLDVDVFTYTSLIHGYCVSGKVDDALALFNEMPRSSVAPNVVTYTALISGLSREGRSDEAFRLYEEMIDAGLTPDDTVYSALVVSASSKCSSTWVHKFAIGLNSFDGPVKPTYSPLKVTAVTDNHISAVGDPGMKRDGLRVAFEAWNFWNEVGSEAPQMGSPRAADCFDLSNSTLVHKVTEAENRLGVGKPFPGLSSVASNNPDLHAAEKEQSGLCPQNGRKVGPFPPTGRFPCFGSGCMNQPLLYHQQTQLTWGSKMKGGFNGTYDLGADIRELTQPKDSLVGTTIRRGMMKTALFVSKGEEEMKAHSARQRRRGNESLDARTSSRSTFSSPPPASQLYTRLALCFCGFSCSALAYFWVS